MFGSELLGVDAAFYLIFIGASALLVGALDLLGFRLQGWAQWALFGVLSIATMVLFRARLYEKFRGVSQDYPVGPAGETISLQQNLAPGESCRMKYRGTTWTVLNDGATAIEQGGKAQIKRVDSLTLVVENENKA